MVDRALFDVFPMLREKVPHAPLADLPTPIEPIAGFEGAYVKRDDLSSPIYGGNKVRTLEMLFAHATRRGAKTVVATGAFGSNHAVATLLHAPRAGLVPAMLLFPQPGSETARDNLRVALSAQHFRALPHWLFLPYGMWSFARSLGPHVYTMVPGGAVPEGALGYLSAALEVARQVEEQICPAPAEIVVGVGSTCTSAGLLLGLAIAKKLGMGLDTRLVSARVTPWPVTSATRIVGLAHRTSAWLATLTGRPELEISRRELGARLVVDGSALGRGYGVPSDAGAKAKATLRDAPFALDSTYTEKSAASFLARSSVPRLYWATKSSAPLPHVAPELLAAAPRSARRFLGL